MCYDRRRAEACVDDGTREEPGTLTQGAPVFPGSSRLGIEPKTPGWLVQDPHRSQKRPTVEAKETYYMKQMKPNETYYRSK